MGFKKLRKAFKKVAKNPLFSTALSFVPGVGGIAATALQASNTVKGLRTRVREAAPQMLPELQALTTQIQQEQVRRKVEPQSQPRTLAPQLRRLEEIAKAVPRDPEEEVIEQMEEEEIEEDMNDQSPEFTFTDAYIELDAACRRCRYS